MFHTGPEDEDVPGGKRVLLVECEKGYIAVQDVPAAELPSVTASADFAVTLADVDSSPASLLETMASGVPLVVGRAPSMEEWIQQGEGGEVVERRDVEAVAQAILRLARDPSLRNVAVTVFVID